jgi:DNA-binding transcriptional LysR family regulator
LTKQIQRLEAKVGGPLFVRSYREVSLTNAGETLQHRARSLLIEAEQVEEAARLAVSGMDGSLRIGFGIASLGAGLPGILMRFRQRFPRVTISMRDMSTPNQIDALVRGDISIGFVRLPLEHPQLLALPILEEPLVAAVPHGLLYRCGLAGLRDQPFVTISRTTSISFFDHFMRTCEAAGFTPRAVQEVNELFTALSLVAAGIGVSLVPRSASKMRVSNVRLRETGLAQAAWKIGIVWRRQT